jgi:hypothetical protein
MKRLFDFLGSDKAYIQFLEEQNVALETGYLALLEESHQSLPSLSELKQSTRCLSSRPRIPSSGAPISRSVDISQPLAFQIHDPCSSKLLQRSCHQKTNPEAKAFWPIDRIPSNIQEWANQRMVHGLDSERNALSYIREIEVCQPDVNLEPLKNHSLPTLGVRIGDIHMATTRLNGFRSLILILFLITCVIDEYLGVDRCKVNRVIQDFVTQIFAFEPSEETVQRLKTGSCRIVQTFEALLPEFDSVYDILVISREYKRYS